MDWSSYYEETVIVPFKSQAPYYIYLLEDYAPYITRRDRDKSLSVALGGLHPKVTKPEDFKHMCEAVFSNPLNLFIIDQNQFALDRFLDDERFIFLQAKLESLPDISPLSLLVCDFTLDFLADRQVQELNRTLPSILDPNGLFIVSYDSALFPGFSCLLHRLKYGVNYYPRTPSKLCRLLSNFKQIYLGNTEDGTNISVFTHRSFPLPEHRGLAFCPNPKSRDIT